jgi:DNA-binding response OmpR family regulator
MTSERNPERAGWPSAGYGSEQPGKRGVESRAPMGPLALVVNRREYPATDVLQALASSGYEVIEQPWPGCVRLAAELRPGLIVVAAAPNRAVDLEVIRELSKSCDAFVVLLAPTSDNLAFGLLAGAHAVLTNDAGAELFAAQFAAARRVPGAGRPAHGLDAPVIAGPLVMDAREHRAWYFAEPLQLSPAEFSILLHLAEHKNSLCPSSQIVAAVTGEELGGRRAAGVLKTQILRIRKELRRVAPGHELISNIYGVGYRLNAGGSDTDE